MEHVYRRLEGLPQRAMLDANVLLNGAFVRGCTADIALRLLIARRYSLLVDDATIRECRTVIARKAVRLALAQYPADWLESYLRQLGVVLVPEAVTRQFNAVNRADSAVASAAQHNDAFLLTGDLKLLAECETDNVTARSPADVMLTGALEWGMNDPMPAMLQATPMRRDRAALFARAFPGNWAGAVKGGSFTIVAVENVGRLFFDAARSAWVFRSAVGDDLEVGATLAPQEPWVVLASFDASRGVIRLRAGVAGNRDYREGESRVLREIRAEGPGPITFGHTTSGSDHWNGALSRVVIGETIPSNDTWKSVLQVPGLAPDPASGDILDAALRRTALIDGAIRLPSAEQLVRSWL